MKYVLVFCFMFIACSAISQTKDEILISRKKHEEIRKNLEDYKKLIIEYNLLKKNFEKQNIIIATLTAENEKLKKDCSYTVKIEKKPWFLKRWVNSIKAKFSKSKSQKFQKQW